MKCKIVAVVLPVVFFGLGIVGCSSVPPEYKITHSFYVIPKDGTGTMDAVLTAAVRHKCLPQMLSDKVVKCTSAHGNIVVNVALSAENDRVTISMDRDELLRKRIKKSTPPEEYNKWVTDFEREIQISTRRQRQ